MKSLFWCALLCAAALVPAADKPAWRLVADANFEPYSYLSEDLAPRGLDVELVSAVMRETGQPFRISLLPWERVKQQLALKEADAGFVFTGTAERRAQYDLVGPLRKGQTVFVVMKRNPLTDWRGLADLKPYVIGQVRGYSYDTEFDKAPLTRDDHAGSPRQLVAMLLAGRVDVIIGDKVQLMYFIQEQRAAGLVKVLPRPLVEMPRYVAFAKGDPRARQFEAALKRLQQSGALQPIFQRWAQ
ncbi:substrate-binding periplasmic protein [Chromobacterium violaceum]|uniref:Glutamine transport system substrate-binding protein n=1 Tax=Chromobacterium violaceum (strain ATCC 12472 / DSM 30191 / JCM 1249 / CCUG 213 / NBRC 12614 / NCIMB 9131 / NCTC 9757 / MK) TaxID=243365 RepID=Q7NRX7_CHRVO|nr:transporter substrate-binding domain-containing protein [Chromobacterium violaceum]AAQ61313.1 glutamine transport system substrate-binding protein [Chromobacterium violaceum ATCC 12472]SUX88313.1 Glutamine-binding periplasmic protein precursor [Chromobacterium violaceum]